MPTPEDGPSSAHTPQVLDEDVLDEVRGGAGAQQQFGDLIFTKSVDKSSRVLATNTKSPPPAPKPAT
jgi:type VI protein secretion system component Hcp